MKISITTARVLKIIVGSDRKKKKNLKKVVEWKGILQEKRQRDNESLLNQVEFSNFFNALIQGNETGKTLDERWKYLKNNLINITKQVCGVSAKHTWKRQTWWWNDKAQQDVSHKRKCFEVWKAGDRDANQAAKRASNLAVHIAKSDAEKIAFKQINPRSVEIYRPAKQMRRENQDVIGEKVDGRLVKEVMICNEKLEIVPVLLFWAYVICRWWM